MYVDDFFKDINVESNFNKISKVRANLFQYAEDIKEYDPQSKTWYKYLKEIQEKGIDFDYHQEVIDEIEKIKNR